VLVEKRRAVGVEVEGVGEVRVRHAVVANTAAPTLFLDLVDQRLVPANVLAKMRRFPFAGGTIKLDWALSAPVPWRSAEARESAVVHTGEDIDDLSRFVSEMRAGKLPENPYLVIGQHSLVDPSRAPHGHHTLYCYSRVPSEVEGGWEDSQEAFADRVEDRIEALAPGFKSLVLGRSVLSPPALQALNANLVGGDLGGGSNAWNRQLLFRPMFPYFRHRMPLEGLYLCSSYTHPGAGVHGMCGYNAAQIISHDLV
jgi:phytoene dehydrogenase-like protein